MQDSALRSMLLLCSATCSYRTREGTASVFLNCFKLLHSGQKSQKSRSEVNKFLNPIAISWPDFNFLNPVWSSNKSCIRATGAVLHRMS